MPFYKCFLRGENFPGKLRRRKGRVGFYTTRWIEASDLEEAELRAVQLLREDDSFKWSGDPPEVADARVYLEKIADIRELPASSGKGAVWYPM